MTFNPYLHGLGEMNVAELAETVYRAHGANETTQLEWKRDWDLDNRPKCAELARHIIGFANRDPDIAARLFGGYAFLLLGVEPGVLGSVAVLDPADIDQRLRRFTGMELAWSPVYVHVRDRSVLVIVVDPPRWGDPVFELCAGSIDPDTRRALKRGTVFVRRPGTTIPAGATDMSRLEARAQTPRPYLSPNPPIGVAGAAKWGAVARRAVRGESLRRGRVAAGSVAFPRKRCGLLEVSGVRAGAGGERSSRRR